jgi:hypothetical protein
MILSSQHRILTPKRPYHGPLLAMHLPSAADDRSIQRRVDLAEHLVQHLNRPNASRMTEKSEEKSEFADEVAEHVSKEDVENGEETHGRPVDQHRALQVHLPRGHQLTDSPEALMICLMVMNAGGIMVKRVQVICAC